MTGPYLSMYLHWGQNIEGQERDVIGLPLLMTFLSTHQSPNTVKRNANEFVIGTVKLNSIFHSLGQYNILSCSFPLLPILSPITNMQAKPQRRENENNNNTYQPSQSTRRTTHSQSG